MSTYRSSLSAITYLSSRRLVLFLSLLLYPCCIVESSSSECFRDSLNTSIAPTFLCSYQVNVTRLKSCSAHVAETILFPHNSGRPWWRTIGHLYGQQINVSSISVTREGCATNFTFSHSIVTVPAKQSERPVRFKLSYVLLNGVNRYSSGCNFSNNWVIDDPRHVNDTQYNILGWTLGQWDKPIDLLTVTFKTTDSNASLAFADSNVSSAKGPEVSVRRTNVSSSVTFNVLEDTSNVCMLSSGCRNSGSKTRNNGGFILAGESRTSNLVIILLVVGSGIFLLFGVYMCYKSAMDVAKEQDEARSDVNTSHVI